MAARSDVTPLEPTLGERPTVGFQRAVMIIGVSQLAQRGLVFPRWFAYVSLLVALVAVLHTWIGVWSALASLAWILVAAVLLLIGR
jgi:hypothetical protein